jgi:hypothetical protein
MKHQRFQAGAFSSMYVCMYPSSLEKALGMNWSPKISVEVIIGNKNEVESKISVPSDHQQLRITRPRKPLRNALRRQF